MKKLIAAAIICLAALGAVSAQDWRSDEDGGKQFNCELVNALKAKAGAESLIRTEAGEQQSLAGFLDYLFPPCARQDSLRLAELIDSEEEEWVVVLYDKVSHEWGEPECSILIDDFYDEHFTFIIGGHRLDGLALDVYLPGEDEPVDMDHVVEDMVRGVPVRYEVLGGNQFPLGQYVFDVHVDDETFHFVWERTDNSMNTVSLSCLGREEDGEADSAAVAADAEAPDDLAREEAAASEQADAAAVADDDTLKDNEKTYIPETPCLIWTEAWDVDLNILIIGQNQEDIMVEIYFPGEDLPQNLDGRSLNEFDDGTPYRVEWIEGSVFPLGLFNIDVTIEGQRYPYQWQREDQSVNTFGVECITIEGD